ncbi:hypothetical protein PR048_021847 [Dryococelus australis]|uniref:Uncharacterized protein n=1 Tax=Dryococelus australis TaxID=614101 RepID=A0ABQ9GZC3_9NEOP|nr:hypothetical protein PR048_021847 [Dryococelus australis]
MSVEHLAHRGDKAKRFDSRRDSPLDFRMWESHWTMPLVGGFFPRGSPISPHHCIPALLHTHLASPSSALRTSIPQPPETLPDLTRAAQMEWDLSPEGDISTLITSMPRRVRDLYNAHGGHSVVGVFVRAGSDGIAGGRRVRREVTVNGLALVASLEINILQTALGTLQGGGCFTFARAHMQSRCTLDICHHRKFSRVQWPVLCILEPQRVCSLAVAPHLAVNGIRKVFPCKSAIGSEACRASINCDPIEKSAVNILCLRHQMLAAVDGTGVGLVAALVAFQPLAFDRGRRARGEGLCSPSREIRNKDSKRNLVPGVGSLRRVERTNPTRILETPSRIDRNVSRTTESMTCILFSPLETWAARAATCLQSVLPQGARGGTASRTLPLTTRSPARHPAQRARARPGPDTSGISRATARSGRPGSANPARPFPCAPSFPRSVRNLLPHTGAREQDVLLTRQDPYTSWMSSVVNILRPCVVIRSELVLVETHFQGPSTSCRRHFPRRRGRTSSGVPQTSGQNLLLSYFFAVANLPWRSQLVRRRSGVREALESNPGAGKREIPEITRRPAVSSGTILTYENLGVTRPGPAGLPLGIGAKRTCEGWPHEESVRRELAELRP